MKNLPASAGDSGSIPGLGRFSGEGNGNPLQYSCLEHPKDRGAWQATVRYKRVGHDWMTKQQQRLSLICSLFFSRSSVAQITSSFLEEKRVMQTKCYSYYLSQRACFNLLIWIGLTFLVVTLSNEAWAISVFKLLRYRGYINTKQYWNETSSGRLSRDPVFRNILQEKIKWGIV